MTFSAALSTPNITQQAYEQLRGDLLTGRLAPGRKLKLAEICQAYAINVSAAREALSRLVAEDLVIAEPQRGFRAAPVSADDLSELTQARLEIETTCLRRAIENGDLAWETRLVAASHHMFRLWDSLADPTKAGEDVLAAHAAFHAALCDGCGNRWLLRLREMLYVQSERYRRLSLPLAMPGRDVDAEHRRILDATLRRDAAEATTLLTAHLSLTTSILLREFGAAGKAG